MIRAILVTPTIFASRFEHPAMRYVPLRAIFLYAWAAFMVFGGRVGIAQSTDDRRSSPVATVEVVVDALFEKFDKNHDGYLTTIELRQIRGIPDLPPGFEADHQVSRQELVDALREVSNQVHSNLLAAPPGSMTTGSDSAALFRAWLKASSRQRQSDTTREQSAKPELNGKVTVRNLDLGGAPLAVIEGSKHDVEIVGRAIKDLVSRQDPGFRAVPLAMPPAPGMARPALVNRKPAFAALGFHQVRTDLWILKTKNPINAEFFNAKTSTEIGEAVSGLSRAKGFKYDHFQFTAVHGKETKIETVAVVPVAESVSQLPNGKQAVQFSNQELGVKVRMLPMLEGNRVAFEYEVQKSALEDSDQVLIERDREPVMAKRTAQLALESTAVCENGKSTCVSVQQSDQNWLVVIVADFPSPEVPPRSSPDAKDRQQAEAARKAIFEAMRQQAAEPGRGRNRGESQSRGKQSSDRER